MPERERSASRILDPTLTISKTLQQRNTILNSKGTKKLKAMNMLKQRRDNFQFGGKDKAYGIFLPHREAGWFFSEIWKY